MNLNLHKYLPLFYETQPKGVITLSYPICRDLHYFFQQHYLVIYPNALVSHLTNLAAVLPQPIPGILCWIILKKSGYLHWTEG